ncbi:MAG TPA: hypothetical protein VFN35_12995 [Ktedonobacteraceae bacterium]|nr:hypothetical protein [Ktedonobacteraceae bacterium]
MILGGIVELLFGIKAEMRSLESVAQPLTVVLEGGEQEGRTSTSLQTSPLRDVQTIEEPGDHNE